MPFTVYVHRNRINGKPYVGFTSRTMRERWNDHLSDARGNRGMCRKFHNAIRKYGAECWDNEIAFQSEDKGEALRFETKLIVEIDAIANGYNITLGGEFGTLGLKMPAGFGEKVSARQMGKKNPCFGRQYSEAERAATGERSKRWHAANPHPNAGKEFSPEWRAKMSAAHKGERNAFFGKRHSEETRRQISENNPMRGAWGWMNPCTRANAEAMAIYRRADEYYSWWLSERRGADVMCKRFGEKRRKPHCTLVDRFRAGWVPTEDPRWVDEFTTSRAA